MSLLIDFKLWRVEWGLVAAAAGLVTALLRRGRPDQALALVLMGSMGWAVWILPERPRLAVLLLTPLILGLAVVMWFLSPKPQSGVSPPRPPGTDAWTSRMHSSLLWLMSVVTVGGVWLAVPDTAVTVVIMMAVSPVAGVAWLDAHRPPWTVNAGVVMLVVIGAISGTAGRTAWIGGLACAGLIPFRRTAAPWWFTLSVHGLVVIVACRAVSRWELVPTVLGSLGLVVGGWTIVQISAWQRGQSVN